jgi:hypothetical protein
MAAALVTVIAGLALGSAVLGGPAEPLAQEPCEQAAPWEADAQALADELAGPRGRDEEVLRQELEEAGFAPGGAPDARDPTEPPRSEDTRWSDLLVELLVALVGALDTDGDGEVGVTVLGPDAADPDAEGVPGSGPVSPGRTCAYPEPAPGATHAPRPR